MWVKTNPPPNLSCRYFTHSAEYVLWARKSKSVPHLFNYELMKAMNGGTQMKDVWLLPAIAKWEKAHGKHPTQKPLPLLSRIVLSCTNEGAWVLDPFSGSATTGIAANLFARNFVGIEREEEFLALARSRREDITDPRVFAEYKSRSARIPKGFDGGGNGKTRADADQPLFAFG